jgi:type I restriction enzyme M protein
LASIEEIRQNDYNLNIPRYVDTSEEEEEIDINEVRNLLTQDKKGY